MKNSFLLATLILLSISASSQTYHVLFQTNKGNIKVVLYDETPKHRDAFLKSVREGLFTNVAFNRVIKDFVSQGGELDETILEREAAHPEQPLKRIDAEIKPNLLHRKGALGAGRNDNPEKLSYLSQIYFVAGRKYTEAQLDALATKKGKPFSSQQREVYQSVGGTPHLDGDYTVFGEIVEGMEVADAINHVPTNSSDLPLTPVTFSVKILKKQ